MKSQGKESSVRHSRYPLALLLPLTGLTTFRSVPLTLTLPSHVHLAYLTLGLSLHTTYSLPVNQDENYRAYKFFSIIDFDNAGSIDRPKLFKLLFGDYVNTFTSVFTHQDTGVNFGLDFDNQICIQQLEEGSPASQLPTLVERLRLVRVNDTLVGPLGGGVDALRTVRATIKRIRRGKVTFEFLEPMMTITSFTCHIDFEIYGYGLHTLVLPLGAVYDLDRICETIRELLSDHESYPMRDLGIAIDVKRKQVFFYTLSGFPHFRLLFASGPNSDFSARFILGFAAEDLPFAQYHYGHNMASDLNLRLTKDECNLLVDDLFAKYDKDDSGDFSFEEFRDFYIQLLDSEEGLKLLRRYTKYRFKYLIRKGWWDVEVEKGAAKSAHKVARREKNKWVVEDQQARTAGQLFVASDGIVRHARSPSADYYTRNLLRNTASPLTLAILDGRADRLAESGFMDDERRRPPLQVADRRKGKGKDAAGKLLPGEMASMATPHPPLVPAPLPYPSHPLFFSLSTHLSTLFYISSPRHFSPIIFFLHLLPLSLPPSLPSSLPSSPPLLSPPLSPPLSSAHQRLPQ